MKTSNVKTSHNHAIIAGWVDGVLAGTTPSEQVLFENGGGTDFAAGDVVVLDTDGTVISTTTAADTRPVGVCLDAIDSGDRGPVAWQGPVPLVNVGASVTAGHYAQTSTVAGEATGSATRGAGSFAVFTSSGTSPTAFLFGAGGGSGVPETVAAAHIADSSDAHDASAISVLDTGGNFTGTDVEAVLAELQDNIDGVSAGTPSFHGAKADKDSTQSINNTTETAVTFPGTDVFDTDAYHDPSSNSSRMTIPSSLGGTYLLAATVAFAPNANGYRYIFFKKNGDTILGYGSQVDEADDASDGIVLTHVDVAALSVGDFVEVFAAQSSGSGLNVTAGDTYFSIALLGA